MEQHLVNLCIKPKTRYCTREMKLLSRLIGWRRFISGCPTCLHVLMQGRDPPPWEHAPLDCLRINLHHACVSCIISFAVCSRKPAEAARMTIRPKRWRNQKWSVDIDNGTLKDIYTLFYIRLAQQVGIMIRPQEKHATMLMQQTQLAERALSQRNQTQYHPEGQKR